MERIENLKIHAQLHPPLTRRAQIPQHLGYGHGEYVREVVLVAQVPAEHADAVLAPIVVDRGIEQSV